MQQVLKTIIIATVCAFLTTFNIAYAKSTANVDGAVPVLHFNAANQSWTTQEIPNMTGLYFTGTGIVTAGNLAWARNAFDDTHIAFYNGSTWQNAISLPNFTNVTNVYPSYPITGQSPVAWALGSRYHMEKVVDYFDGNHWNSVTIQGIGSKQNTSFHIAKLVVSNGRAWIFGYYEHSNTIFVTTTNVNNPSTFSEPTAIPDIDVTASGQHVYAQSFNDDASYVFVYGAKPDFSKYELMRIDANKNVKIVQTFPNSIYKVDVTGSNILVGYQSADKTTKLIYSHDNGNTWSKPITSPINAIATWNRDDPFPQVGVGSGVICGSDNAKAKGATSFYCINTNDANDTWGKHHFAIKINPQLDRNWAVFADQNGAWVIVLPNDPDASILSFTPQVFRFNLKTNTLTDTNIASVAKGINTGPRPIARVLNGHLILRGEDKDGNNASFYYNGTKWIVSPLPNMPSTNYLSVGGNTDPLSYKLSTTSTNLWLFSYS